MFVTRGACAAMGIGEISFIEIRSMHVTKRTMKVSIDNKCTHRTHALKTWPCNVYSRHGKVYDKISKLHSEFIIIMVIPE